MVAATGLVVSHDWVSCAPSRCAGGWRGWPSGWARSRPWRARSRRGRSLSLHWPVVLAHSVPVRPPERDAGARSRWGAQGARRVLSAYRAASHRSAPVARPSPRRPTADRALLVDDSFSDDDTVEIALAGGWRSYEQSVNRGYGANQKTCYTRAIQDGADVVVMVHADDQYDPAPGGGDGAPRSWKGRADAVMGSRMLRDRHDRGRHAPLEVAGNRVLTAVENRAFDRSWSEYHTGYRAFSTELLRSIAFLRNDDEFGFTSRSSPSWWRAARGWWSCRSPRATSTRPPACRSDQRGLRPADAPRPGAFPPPRPGALVVAAVPARHAVRRERSRAPAPPGDGEAPAGYRVSRGPRRGDVLVEAEQVVGVLGVLERDEPGVGCSGP